LRWAADRGAAHRAGDVTGDGRPDVFVAVAWSGTTSS
jgi:hypothetical protein